ncbi:MAG: DJ-1/PfpI family protein [Acidobacteriota bacterium]
MSADEASAGTVKTRTVGIVIFDDVEVLDFAGPFEVFSRVRLEAGPASRLSDEGAPFHAITIAPTNETITAIGGLRVIPDHGLADAPELDILLIPGGWGARALLEREDVLEWIRQRTGNAEILASVCTGSLVLAQAGLLEGKRATTHWAAIDALGAIDPTITVESHVRWTDDGIYTSAGVAAGIDLAFHIVETLHGRDVADETAKYIDYPRRYVP